MKKKSISILGIVVAVLLLIVVCVTLTLNVLFSQHDTPKIFGNYVYLMETDSMEVKPAESTDPATTVDVSASIHAKTAVICKAYDGSEPLSKNNAILCVLAPEDTSTDKDSEGMAIRRILNIASDEETGVMKYYPTTMQVEAIGTEPAITVDSVRGICRYESSQLYSFIQFATGFSGIIVLLALPCVILVILLVMALVRRSAKNQEDDAYAFEESYDELAGEDDYNYDDEEYDDEEFVNDIPQPSYQNRTGNTGNYNTNSYNMEEYPPNAGYGNTAMPGMPTSFETKKSSISQNFERKAVNPNSAYQKAKTMQFQAQKNVQIPETKYSQMPQQDMGNNGYVGKYSTEVPVESAPPVQPEQTYHGAHEAPSGSSKTFLTSTGTFKRPNVDDIFGNDSLARNTSAPRQRSAAPTKPAAKPVAKPTIRSTRSASYDKSSVDDLVAMIENQKKKL